MPVYKNEKSGTWFSKFYYTDWTGARKQKKKEGFRTKKEAQDFEREFLNKTHASCDMSFRSLVELYMEDCKTRLKPTTYANKEFLITTKLLPFFKDMPINTITAATIRKWQNELLADPKGYSPTYLKTLHNQELICKGWFLPPNTYDCGSFVVNGTAVIGKESKDLNDG